MVNVDGSGKLKKMTPIYLIVSLIIFIIHMIMSIVGKIHIFHIIISPMLFTVTISFASYFLEDKMPIIIVLLMTYATSMGVINVVVDRKVKKMRIDRM